MDMHSKELRVGGESEKRLYLLSAWRECPFRKMESRQIVAKLLLCPLADMGRSQRVDLPVNALSVGVARFVLSLNASETIT
jgi:hypothetical protein